MSRLSSSTPRHHLARVDGDGATPLGEASVGKSQPMFRLRATMPLIAVCRRTLREAAVRREQFLGANGIRN